MAAWPLPAAPSLLGWGPAVSWCCWPWRRPCGAGLRPGPPSRHCPRGRTSWLNRYGGGGLGEEEADMDKGGRGAALGLPLTLRRTLQDQTSASTPATPTTLVTPTTLATPTTQTTPTTQATPTPPALPQWQDFQARQVWAWGGQAAARAPPRGEDAHRCQPVGSARGAREDQPGPRRGLQTSWGHPCPSRLLCLWGDWAPVPATSGPVTGACPAGRLLGASLLDLPVTSARSSRGTGSSWAWQAMPLGRRTGPC